MMRSGYQPKYGGGPPANPPNEGSSAMRPATEVTKEDIGDVLGGLMKRIDAEYQSMTENDVRARWYFKFDGEKPLRINIYEFHKMLELYRSSCRRWEEMHNGSSCVVERVRDKYLMPKIIEFEQNVREHVNAK